MSGNLTPPEQFEKLGLALSGGGVRAVGFHLGTLEVLEQLGLLEKVRTLSTVSGGSLVGIGYALSLKVQPAISFTDFFKAFFEFLPPLNTMDELAEGVDELSPSGHRTMVGAMSRIYRDHYFGQYFGNPKFSIFWQATPKIHLENLVFNATDFKTGLAFRFQYNDTNQGKIGSDQVTLTEAQAGEFYMSDIMTTSACLPAMLEPMLIPQDYELTDTVKQDIRNHFQANCQVEFDYVALMDGGMLDNQGVTGILSALAQNIQPQPPSPLPSPLSPWDYGQLWRSRFDTKVAPDIDTVSYSMTGAADSVIRDELPMDSPEPGPVDSTEDTDTTGTSLLELAIEDLDLLIISDTPGYKAPEKRYFPKKDLFAQFTGVVRWLLNRTLNFYFIVWLILFLAGVASLVLVIWGLVSAWLAAPPGTGFIKAILDVISASNFPGPLKIGLIAMVFVAIPIMIVHMVGWAFAWIKARDLEDVLNATIPLRGKSLWHYIKGLRVRELWHMTKLRLLSVLRLTSEIFMNRVRQLSYRWVLEKPSLEARIIPNEIFKLKVVGGAGSMTPRGPHQLPNWLTTTTADIDDIVEVASSMKTQIHLDDQPGQSAEDNLKLLVSCGQITTSFNLLEYLWQFHSDGNVNSPDPFPGKPAAKALFDATRIIWDKLKLDPYHYVNLRLT